MKNTNQRASDSYIMTVHTKSAGDMLELQTIRKAIKAINKMAASTDATNNARFQRGWTDVKPLKSPRYRVKCQGRGSRTVHAINDGKHARKYDQFLPLRHAERMDVYVYKV